MKRKIKLSAYLLAVLLSFFTINTTISYAYTVSKAEAVMEVMSGRMLYSFNAEEKLPMASTTKIITAITVLDNFDIYKTVEVPSECVGVEGSSIYLKQGEKYTVCDLLYGLMLRSGNDAAETLAVTLAGSVSEFVKLMNETMKKVGAVNSSLVNPHGLNAENHYTTAEDLAKISVYAMKNETFKKIVNSKTHIATEITSGEKKLWKNKNKILSMFEGAEGVKTGYTVKAGRCLVSCAKRKGMEVVSVVLNSPQMFERSCELLENSFTDFDMVKVIDGKRFDYVVFDKAKNNAYEIESPDDFYYPVKRGEKLSCELNFENEIRNTDEKSQKAAEIKIYCSKQLIFSQKLYTLNPRNKTNENKQISCRVRRGEQTSLRSDY